MPTPINPTRAEHVGRPATLIVHEESGETRLHLYLTEVEFCGPAFADRFPGDPFPRLSREPRRYRFSAIARELPPPAAPKRKPRTAPAAFSAD